MASTSAATTSPTAGTPRRSSGHPNLIGIAVVLLVTPLIGLLASSAEFITVGAVFATLTLLLVVLWSAEATFYVLIFSMLLSPEFIVGDLGGASAATASRGVTLRLDDFVIATIGLAWLVRLAVFKETAVLRRTPLNGPIAAYLGFAAISTLWGATTGRVSLITGSFFVLKYLEYTVIYFLVVNYVKDRAQVRRLLIAALTTAIIISIVAIAQIPSGVRVSAPFEGENGEPNTLGGYLVLMIAMALACAGESKTHRARVIYLGTAVTMMIPLAFTYSRTSWLAFIAMLGVTILLSSRRSVLLLMVAAFLVAMIVSPPETLVERATYTLSSTRASVQFLGFAIEPSAAARLEAWIIAANTLAIYPILGAGVTGAGLIDAQYPRVIAETGLIGLLLFLWMVGRLMGTGVELLRTSDNNFDITLAKGFLAGFVGLLVHGIGANTFIIVRIMEPMWLLAGLVGASLLIISSERASSAAGRLTPATAGIRAPAPPAR